MSISELEIVTGTKMKIEYYHDQRRFSAKLAGASVIEGKNGGVTCSAYGEGPSAIAAQRQYAKEIKGKRIRIEDREYDVPDTLS